MGKSESVTGRDGYIIRKALAYAIETIERLPERWQEWSDKEDMKTLLAALTEQGDFYRTGALAHIERRGIAVEEGRAVLAPRDPATVVALRPEGEDAR